MSNDPYCRIYWRLSDEFPEVFDDAAVLGTYVQLLVAADAMWPSKPHLPAGAETAVLTECGLVELHGRRYTIKGLDKERKRRSKAGRRGAAGRWSDADRNADRIAAGNALGNAVRIASGNADAMPSQAKPSQAKPSQAETNTRKREEKSPGNRERTKRLTPLNEILGAKGA